MKKITLKLIAFVLFAISTTQISAQAFEAAPGLYRVQVQGEDLTLTIASQAVDGVWALTYEAVDLNNNNQVFLISPVEIVDDETGELVPNLWSFEAVAGNQGAMEVEDITNNNSSIVFRGNAVGQENRIDIFNPTRGMGTQIFSEAQGFTAGAKRRIQNFELGRVVSLSGGSPVAFDFIPVEALSTASNVLTSSDFSISNIGDQLNISSAALQINEVAVYSILGKNVLSESGISLSSVNMNTSSLSTGMYIVKIGTDKGFFSTKIVVE
ncbi:T9SS C-terminal target domain-containing protein [Polaribacter sp. WD7]|uniref:T9SS type A sorting domain-containing protein n=1 Tax=Polaribacter sp. WD7 TaxID=2269061 RepID=UPI000DF327DB|nr:T9SS type A sorting domain-containing protein [Polaribacter sp. WD7]RCS26685.1 T9SS C-terminal target domain-containing protein [Polaribacter sp. WD7]